MWRIIVALLFMSPLDYFAAEMERAPRETLYTYVMVGEGMQKILNVELYFPEDLDQGPPFIKKVLENAKHHIENGHSYLIEHKWDDLDHHVQENDMYVLKDIFSVFAFDMRYVVQTASLQEKYNTLLRHYLRFYRTERFSKVVKLTTESDIATKGCIGKKRRQRAHTLGKRFLKGDALKILQKQAENLRLPQESFRGGKDRKK